MSAQYRYGADVASMNRRSDVSVTSKSIGRHVPRQPAPNATGAPAGAPSGRLWTDADLAKYFGIDPATVGNRVSRRRDMPPYVKIGGKRRWVPYSVQEWLREREVRTPAHRRGS